MKKKQPYLRKLDIKLVPGDYKNPLKGQVKGPEQLYDVFKDLEDSHVEKAIVVYIAENADAIAYHILGVGNDSSVSYDNAELFGTGYVLKAKRFIFIHNHPSGNSNPSPRDLVTLDILRAQSAIMNLPMLDYIIIGAGKKSKKNNYWSFNDKFENGEYSDCGIYNRDYDI